MENAPETFDPNAIQDASTFDAHPTEIDPLSNSYGTEDLEGWLVGNAGGKDMWAITRHVLEKTPAFNDLPPGSKVNAIDSIYQKFVHMNPSELRAIGIASGNVHKISEGISLDLSEVMTPANLHQAVEHAQTISAVKQAGIMEHVRIVENFMRSHPKTSITEGLVNKLIAQAAHK